MSDPLGTLGFMSKLHVPFLQIAGAARNLYAADGPKGFTMRKLAAVLGVSATTLYRHFKNKDAILDAVCQRAEGELAARLGRPQPGAAELDLLVERSLGYAAEQPQLSELIVRRKAPWDKSDSSREGIFRSCSERAIEASQAAPDKPEQTAQALWAQVCGVVMLRSRGELETPTELKTAGKDATQRLMNGLRLPPRMRPPEHALAAVMAERDAARPRRRPPPPPRAQPRTQPPPAADPQREEQRPPAEPGLPGGAVSAAHPEATQPMATA